jgi:hypothetical protein
VNRWVTIALVSALWPTGCGKNASSTSPTSAHGEDEPEAALSPMDAREAAQWAAAAPGDPEELMRIADLVGCEGLRDRASQPELRAIAIHAMQYCQDYAELPWLAELGGGKNEADGQAALEAIDALAARPRRATDPEDADELHVGCGALLAIARSTSLSRQRRVLAVRALRMLSERGCVRRADIPTDVDVK